MSPPPPPSEIRLALLFFFLVFKEVKLNTELKLEENVVLFLNLETAILLFFLYLQSLQGHYPAKCQGIQWLRTEGFPLCSAPVYLGL